MNMQSTKAQHYVPRLYLKQWADEDEKIWCLDRKKNNIFNSNIMGVAQQRFFYEMKQLRDEDFVILEKLWVDNRPELLQNVNKGIIDDFKKVNGLLNVLDSTQNVEAKKLKDYAEKNLVEKMFASYEGQYLSLISDILATGIPKWNENAQMSFLFFLILQYFRTKNISDNLLESIKKLPNPAQFDGFIERAMNPMRWLMANTVTYNSLVRRKIVFIENKSTLDFITTDQPVINVYAAFGKSAVEMSEDELELYCPLSPQKAVLISFKDCYTDMSSISGSEKDVRIYNGILVKCSNRFVFSKDKGGLNPWLEENQ